MDICLIKSQKRCHAAAQRRNGMQVRIFGVVPLRRCVKSFHGLTQTHGNSEDIELREM
jgi:hypothetical protein